MYMRVFADKSIMCETLNVCGQVNNEKLEEIRFRDGNVYVEMPLL